MDTYSFIEKAIRWELDEELVEAIIQFYGEGD